MWCSPVGAEAGSDKLNCYRCKFRILKIMIRLAGANRLASLSVIRIYSLSTPSSPFFVFRFYGYVRHPSTPSNNHKNVHCRRHKLFQIPLILHNKQPERTASNDHSRSTSNLPHSRTLTRLTKQTHAELTMTICT